MNNEPNFVARISVTVFILKVGKTSLITMFMDDNFEALRSSSIGTECRSKTIFKLNGATVR